METLFDDIDQLISAHASKIAIAASLIVTLLASIDGAFFAVGSDPYGYVTQSLLWAAGNPMQSLPEIARAAPVDPFAFCPLGYRPALAAGMMVPTYAPGFPLQMAALILLTGPEGGYYVLPIRGGLVVWLSYVFALRIMSRGGALLAAIVAASSPNWSFLRFLLPSVPLLLVTATAIFCGGFEGTNRAARVAAILLCALMIPFAYVHTAAKGDAFKLRDLFRVTSKDSARFALEQLPSNAVFVSLTESGSLRFYANRLTIRYDWVESEQLDALVEYLVEQKLTPYAALSRQEVAEFTSKFRSSTALRLAVMAPSPELKGDVVFLHLGLAR